jgi:hypothetical protein
VPSHTRRHHLITRWEDWPSQASTRRPAQGSHWRCSLGQLPVRPRKSPMPRLEPALTSNTTSPAGLPESSTQPRRTNEGILPVEMVGAWITMDGDATLAYRFCSDGRCRFAALLIQLRVWRITLGSPECKHGCVPDESNICRSRSQRGSCCPSRQANCIAGQPATERFFDNCLEMKTWS